MLRAKDYRERAWGKLKGKWGTAALIAFVYSLIMGACSALSYFVIGGIAAFLITGPFALGLAAVALRIMRTEEIEVGQLFGGFKNFGTAFLVSLLNGIFIFLWTLLFIVPGIIKTYSYRLSYYILADNPTMSATEVRKRSIELMRGNKWRLFCLEFSFIGWELLCILTLGILSFWVASYYNAAIAEFYQSLLPQKQMQATEDLPPV